MPRKKTEPNDTITLLILRDGVFVAEDERRDEGDQCAVKREIAEKIIGNGHGRLV
jgi:hypothetical protein